MTIHGVSTISMVCNKWQLLYKNDIIWKNYYYHDFINQERNRNEGIEICGDEKSWFEQYLKIYNLSHWVPLTRTFFHLDEVWLGTWSPDGKYLCTSGKDGYLGIWILEEWFDIPMNLNLTLYSSHNVDSMINYHHWNPNSNQILLTTSDNNILLYNVTQDSKPTKISMIPALQFTNWLDTDNYLLFNKINVTEQGNHNIIQRVDTKQKFIPTHQKDIIIQGDCYMPKIKNNGVIAVARGNGDSIVMDTITLVKPFGQDDIVEYKNLEVKSYGVNDCINIKENGHIIGYCFSTDGKYLITNVRPQTNLDKTEESYVVETHIWDLESMFLVHKFDDITAFSPIDYSFIILPFTAIKNEIILSGSEDGSFHIFHLKHGFSLTKVQANKSLVNSVVMHPKYNLLVCCSDNHDISLWTTKQNGVFVHVSIPVEEPFDEDAEIENIYDDDSYNEETGDYYN